VPACSTRGIFCHKWNGEDNPCRTQEDKAKKRKIYTAGSYGSSILQNLAVHMDILTSTEPAGRLGVIFFPAFDWAISATHPEREERLLYTRDQLLEEGVFDLPGITEYRPFFASEAQLERAHFCLPSVAEVCTDSHHASAGGAIRGARLVMEGIEERAFVLTRPPGHHAMRVVHGNRGFCNINNEAVMIEYIRDHYPHPDGRPLRIAIVDTDVHHGDGTQDLFWNDPHTLFISLHQDGRTLYPGTGFLGECGGPGALGRNINIPLPPNTADEGYLYAIEHAVLPILQDFKPDLIVNSAGQDNHFTDPLANMKLSAQGYAALTRALDPDIAVLEGGYSIRGALPYVNLGICLALAGLPADEIREPDWSPASAHQDKATGKYIAQLCEQVRDVYFRPPAEPIEGQEESGWWVRHKRIFYDTDMLRENQVEGWRLCPDCSGLGRIETVSERTARSLCILIPRHACSRCRAMGHELQEAARKKSRHAHILLLDGDAVHDEKDEQEEIRAGEES
jgi:acetoin utilization deacetylase AcuC-like enzyme